MDGLLSLEMSLLEIIIRGAAGYIGINIATRLIPKRQIGDLSPNDLIALIIVGSLAADAILGGATGLPEIALMVGIVLGLDYFINMLEFFFPRFHRISHGEPTLLIHNGEILHKNLRKELLTQEELIANLRRHGLTDVERVRVAVLEVDGRISVIEYD